MLRLTSLTTLGLFAASSQTGCSEDKAPGDAVVVVADGAVESGDSDGSTGCAPPPGLWVEISSAGEMLVTGASLQERGAFLSPTFSFAAEIIECDDDCRSNCRFRGPLWTRDSAPFFRCSSDLGATCKTSADCGAGICVPFAAGPSTQRFLVDRCQFQSFELDSTGEEWPVLGTIDLDSGAMSIERMRVRMQEASGNLSCRACQEDELARDGHRQGHCAVTGEQVPYACDVHGARADGHESGEPSSFDCLMDGFVFDPDVGPVHDYAGVSTGTTTFTLTEDSPDCDLGGGKCFCGICEGTDAQCSHHSDCGTGGVCATDAGTRYDVCERNEGGSTVCDAETNLCPHYTAATTVPMACGVTRGEIGDALVVAGTTEVNGDLIQATLVGARCLPAQGFFDDVIGLPGVEQTKLPVAIRVLDSLD